MNGLFDGGFESVKAHFWALQARVPIAVLSVSQRFAGRQPVIQVGFKDWIFQVLERCLNQVSEDLFNQVGSHRVG